MREPSVYRAPGTFVETRKHDNRATRFRPRSKSNVENRQFKQINVNSYSQTLFFKTL